ncbi:hypothetical protein PYW07_005453 [Mythimna separata]|uniref:Trichohyalin-plectin-homology domain-containing protein n=1 Tax=Mythimna separata TaxID=271217 RepID=A0AAD8DP07_MYTSE|nr:hypothetical protein PYW07_005453 [Mythimna separata]
MPIIMTKDEWDRIHKWADYDGEDPEVVRRREYVKYLNETSQVMTKSWPNSLENVNKRNEELRMARNLQAEQVNTKFYARYLRKKKEQQERLMYSARDMVFKNKDAPKLLLSAVIETAVQKERNEQVKFINERRKEEAERKRQDDDEIIRRAKEWHELMALRKKRRWDANKRHQKALVDQAHEVSERNRREYETELNLQKIDNILADEQMNALKQFDKEFKAEKKASIFRAIEQDRKETMERKHEQDVRDKMDDKLIEVLQKSRCRIEQRRKKTEADLKNEKLRVLEKISQRLESGDAARNAKEQAILDKAVKEKNELSEARHQELLKKQAQFRQERKENREKFLKAEEQRLHDFNNQRQWDIMNRFKNAEIYEDFQENLRKKKEKQIAEYRAEILRLWKEREDREAKERADTRYFYGELAEQKLRAADNKLLTHAAGLLQEAKENGRPDYALHRAIDKLRAADNKLLTHAAGLLQEAKENGRPDYALHRAIDVSTDRTEAARCRQQAADARSRAAAGGQGERPARLRAAQSYRSGLLQEAKENGRPDYALHRAIDVSTGRTEAARCRQQAADARSRAAAGGQGERPARLRAAQSYRSGLLQEAKENGRPDYALHRAIDAYCKLYRLYPMPDLPRSMKEHFKRYAPWDGSKPDASYVEPPPPHPRKQAVPLPAPNAPDAVRADGMQGVDKPGPSKHKEEKKEENVQDYKRTAPANGLQRRNLEQTFTLPPITVVPCTNESCRCELKSAAK